MPPSFLPPRLNFENYWAIAKTSVPFLQIYMNSVMIAVLVTVGAVVAGYTAYIWGKFANMAAFCAGFDACRAGFGLVDWGAWLVV